MVRRVDVPPQKVWGGVPLQLPLIRMSEAEAIILHGQPQIYDSPYPLEYDGTGLAPNWSSMGFGMDGLATFGNVAMLPGEAANQNILHRTQVTIPFNKAAVKQKIMDRRLRLPPRTFAAHARTFPAPAAFGNIAMLPHEVSQMSGMGWLGLTAAQQKQAANQAAAVAKKQQQQAEQAAKKAAADAAAAKRKADADAAKQAAANAAAAKKQATANATQKKQDDAAALKVQQAADKTHNALLAFNSSCVANHGVWDDATNTCSGYTDIKSFTAAQKVLDRTNAQAAKQQAATDKLTAKQTTAQDRAACIAQPGMKWDARSGTCIGKPITQAQLNKLMKDCQKSGGTYDVANSTCVPGSAPSTQQCTPGSVWDPATSMCLPQAPGAQQCQAGYTWDPSLLQCMPPLNPVVNPTDQFGAAQCAAQGGFWDGQQCIPPRSFIEQAPPPNPYPPYPPQTSAIPPGYDGGYGGGGGGGMPMTGGGGSGMPMMNEQASQYSPSVEQEGQTPDDTTQTDQSGDTEVSENKDEDAASSVASTNVFESISKLFSGGMHGVGCGRSAAPAWVGMGGPNVPQFAVAQEQAPIKSSTTTGVIAGSMVLVAVAAAIFLWSKGNK